MGMIVTIPKIKNYTAKEHLEILRDSLTSFLENYSEVTIDRNVIIPYSQNQG